MLKRSSLPVPSQRGQRSYLMPCCVIPISPVLEIPIVLRYGFLLGGVTKRVFFPLQAVHGTKYVWGSALVVKGARFRTVRTRRPIS